MTRILKRLGIYLLAVLLSLLLYVPFRLLADKYQQILVAGTNNFYYPFATFIWPLFTLVLGAGPAYFGSRMRIPIYVRIPVYFLLVGSWDYLPGLDMLLDVEGCNYLSSYNSTNPGQFNTTYLSCVLQPICYFVGIVLGELGGWLKKKRLANEMSFRGAAPGCE